MNTQFERSNKTTIEWYTPPEIIETLGKFDLDPCTSEAAYKLNHSADNFYTKQEDGLAKKWFGRIWLNPPYEQPSISRFIKRMAQHNNGIALLYNRCDNKLFHDIIFPTADSIYFLHDRIYFFKPDGYRGDRPGCGSILVSWGENNTNIVLKSRLKGTLLKCMHAPQKELQTKLNFSE